MKDRLTLALESAKKKKKKVFCAFLTLGFPNLKATEKLLWEIESSGADIVELGFPFSDPLADGPTIQHSSEMALKKGVQVKDAFCVIKGMRKKGFSLPVVFFTYLNPVHSYGYKKFVSDAKKSGFDGILIPDLPPDEEKDLQKICHESKFPQIFLVAPTTAKDRSQKIMKKSQGFVYYVSLKGVTGVKKSVASEVSRHVKQLKRLSSKSILVGFGVSKPEQARKLSGSGDGVIVGSAIVDKIGKSKNPVKPVGKYVRQMVRALQS